MSEQLDADWALYDEVGHRICQRVLERLPSTMLVLVSVKHARAHGP
jgi:hypothetical protein